MDGNYYHIYGRGNHRDVVFREVPDRVRFLSKLEEYCDRDQQSIIAYCLMNNHYHLALRQDGERPLSATLRSLLQGYAQFYNRKYGTVGSLFQGRFQSKLVDHPLYNPWHLARLTRYIHRNPLSFGDFERYRWSSYREYVAEARGGRESPGLCDLQPVMELFGDKASYATFCTDGPPSERGRRPGGAPMGRVAAPLL
jgi:REP element-mobilizing transposase RayT